MVDTGQVGSLTLTAVIYGLAAMQPHTANCDERLRYIFRLYADPASHRSAAIIKFPQFVNMVRPVEMHTGPPTPQNADGARSPSPRVGGGTQHSTTAYDGTMARWHPTGVYLLTRAQ